MRSTRRAAGWAAPTSSVRAIASRWRSPPDSMTPSSPTGASSPSSLRSSTSVRLTACSTSMHCWSVASGRPERQVLADGSGEHRRILFDIADLGAEVGALEPTDVDAAESHDARGRVVEPLDEREDGALARAGRADQRGALAARSGERDAVQDRAVVRRPRGRLGTGTPASAMTFAASDLVRLLRVGEDHVVEADRVILSRSIAATRGDARILLALARQLDDLLDAPERAERLAHRGDGAERGAER